ncbi:MAG: hypothetical protein M1836_007235 [Candelina mexicana]|nr:MAG: hypothetical protein M1836_007235 [Candelina mexicana]
MSRSSPEEPRSRANSSRQTAARAPQWATVNREQASSDDASKCVSIGYYFREPKVESENNPQAAGSWENEEPSDYEIDFVDFAHVEYEDAEREVEEDEKDKNGEREDDEEPEAGYDAATRIWASLKDDGFGDEEDARFFAEDEDEEREEFPGVILFLSTYFHRVSERFRVEGAHLDYCPIDYDYEYTMWERYHHTKVGPTAPGQGLQDRKDRSGEADTLGIGSRLPRARRRNRKPAANLETK